MDIVDIVDVCAKRDAKQHVELIVEASETRVGIRAGGHPSGWASTGGPRGHAGGHPVGVHAGGRPRRKQTDRRDKPEGPQTPQKSNLKKWTRFVRETVWRQSQTPGVADRSISTSLSLHRARVGPVGVIDSQSYIKGERRNRDGHCAVRGQPTWCQMACQVRCWVLQARCQVRCLVLHQVRRRVLCMQRVSSPACV